MLINGAEVLKIFRNVARRNELEPYHHFAVQLNWIWQKRWQPARMGLAISGGVDSMALAFLSQEAANPHSKLLAPLYSLDGYPETITSFTGFIVDHKIRKDSTTEALLTASRIEKLGIEPRILELDWESEGDPSTIRNLETVARKLRYQALGKACRDAGANTLLLAHHENDQHETALMRIISQYTGVGLQGMNRLANIPECRGIYGVDHSGRPQIVGQPDKPHQKDAYIPYEFGGIRVGRPLLSLKKASLVEICTQNNVSWAEDPTNADATLTLRNTVRQLTKNHDFPPALQRRRLTGMLQKIKDDNHRLDRAANDSWIKMPIRLDCRIGVARISIPDEVNALSHGNYRLRAELVRQMLELVSPLEVIALQSLDVPVDMIFEKSEETPRTTHMASVQVSEVPFTETDNGRIFGFHRVRPSKLDITASATTFPLTQGAGSVPEWSGWILWDGRYWIRVRPPPGNQQDIRGVGVKFLSKAMLAEMRASLGRRRAAMFDQRLRMTPGDIRFTLPAIVVSKTANVELDRPTESVVALPTLNCHVPGWARDTGFAGLGNWLYDVRYKYVALDVDGEHRVINRVTDLSLVSIHRESSSSCSKEGSE